MDGMDTTQLMKSHDELLEEIRILTEQLEVQKIINESLVDVILKVKQVLNLNYSYNQNIEQAEVLLSVLSSLKEIQN